MSAVGGKSALGALATATTEIEFDPEGTLAFGQKIPRL